MKSKIIEALKTTYSNLGLSEKALDGVASFLEKTVTKEEDIQNTIVGENVAVLLKAFQGDLDRLRTQNSGLSKELETLKKNTPMPPVPPNPAPAPDKDSEIAKLLKAQQDRLDALEAKNRELETRERNSNIISELKTRLKNGGSDNEAILKLTLKGISVKEDDTADTLAESAKAAYDANFKEFYGDGVVPPASTKHIEGYKRGDFSAEVERLKAEGKLPK